MSDLLTQHNLSFDLALAAITGALETARSRGYHVGVAVVDRGGEPDPHPVFLETR
jgi:uncharacterized protein GlcG (DUF336 family)